MAWKFTHIARSTYSHEADMILTSKWIFWNWNTGSLASRTLSLRIVNSDDHHNQYNRDILQTPSFRLVILTKWSFHCLYRQLCRTLGPTNVRRAYYNVIQYDVVTHPDAARILRRTVVVGSLLKLIAQFFDISWQVEGTMSRRLVLLVSKPSCSVNCLSVSPIEVCSAVKHLDHCGLTSSRSITVV